MSDTESPPRPRPTDRLRIDQGFECEHCGHRWYYTRPRCAECRGAEFAPYDLPRGELLSVTEVHATPPDVRSPNRLGLARFGDVQLIAQLDGDASSGDPVEFAGAHRLRSGDEEPEPRLTPV